MKEKVWATGFKKGEPFYTSPIICTNLKNENNFKR